MDISGEEYQRKLIEALQARLILGKARYDELITALSVNMLAVLQVQAGEKFVTFNATHTGQVYDEAAFLELAGLLNDGFIFAVNSVVAAIVATLAFDGATDLGSTDRPSPILNVPAA